MSGTGRACWSKGGKGQRPNTSPHKLCERHDRSRIYSGVLIASTLPMPLVRSGRLYSAPRCPAGPVVTQSLSPRVCSDQSAAGLPQGSSEGRRSTGGPGPGRRAGGAKGPHNGNKKCVFHVEIRLLNLSAILSSYSLNIFVISTTETIIASFVNNVV